MTNRVHYPAARLVLMAAVLAPALGCASAGGRGEVAGAVPVPAAEPEADVLVAEPPRIRPPGGPEAPEAECLTEYDCLRRDVARASRSGRIRALQELVLDITEQLDKPDPAEKACWRHLRATALVELGEHDRARDDLELLAISCPVWESLNNLAFLEALEGQLGPAKRHFREAREKAEIDAQSGSSRDSDRYEIPATNLEQLQAREKPFLTLVGVITECSGAERPTADCGGKIEARTALAAGGTPIPARFAVFTLSDDSTRGELVAESPGEQSRFEATVPDGTYLVAAAAGKALVERRVRVGAGATSSLDLAMDAGRLTASWRLAPGAEPEPARFQVLRDGEPVAETASPVASFSVIVPAGEYLLRAEGGPLSGSARQFVSPGADTEVSLDPGVAAALEAWRRAWSEQNADRYLRAYVENYTPHPETSPAGWARERRRKIDDKSFIEVVVREPSYRQVDGARVAVSFIQDYRSTPRDAGRRPFCSTGTKTLTFERLSEDWKIIRGTCAGCDDRTDCP